jgi:hypothetical protein
MQPLRHHAGRHLLGRRTAVKEVRECGSAGVAKWQCDKVTEVKEVNEVREAARTE